MDRFHKTKKNLRSERFWFLPGWIGLILVVGVFLSARLVSYKQTEISIREKIVARYGEILSALTELEWQNYWKEWQEIDPDFLPEDTELAVITILEATTLPSFNVLGAVLFDLDFHPVATFPTLLNEMEIPDDAILKMSQDFIWSRYMDDRDWKDQFLVNPKSQSLNWNDLVDVGPEMDPDGDLKILEVAFPLKLQNLSQGRDAATSDPEPIGYVLFLVDAEDLDQEWESVRQDLFCQALVSGAIGGSVILLILLVVFSRLQKTNRILSRYSDELFEVNRNLSQALKTNAVGAVSSHLIHELKNQIHAMDLSEEVSDIKALSYNPRQFVEEAQSRVQQMKRTLNEIITILQDESIRVDYDLTISEFIEELQSILKSQNLERCVDLTTNIEPETIATLSNRNVDLSLLIIRNITQNAVEASPNIDTDKVEVSLTLVGCETLEVRVRDHGPGFSVSDQRMLFLPGRSSKQGGAGLGLSICYQLAKAMEAELCLEKSGPNGSVFLLKIPARPGGRD